MTPLLLRILFPHQIWVVNADFVKSMHEKGTLKHHNLSVLYIFVTIELDE